MNKLRQELAALRAALKPMSGIQRIEHIWSYYKEVILIALIVLFLVVAAIISLVNAGIKVLFSGVLPMWILRLTACNICKRTIMTG